MSSNKQAIMLGDYQLGAILGKGGYGSVFQGVNIRTGAYVAIKQIQLSKIPKDQLSGIVTEIDLLQKLDHPNIVKYLGYSKTSEYLHIILEFVENGSLSGVVQKFGRFPESLARVYISQVLTGLNYLHQQGVIHRDIKGANILATKQGDVKLADFGVAVDKVNAKREVDAVVGTPYWMAPEIIELAGASTKSDIWSVGCTVIELLTGEPPYFDLAPMPALFRIVQDEHPPLPSDISPALRDFLMECLKKDPNRRTNAEDLLKHPWVRGNISNITQISLSSPPANFEDMEKNLREFNKDLPSNPEKEKSLLFKVSSKISKQRSHSRYNSSKDKMGEELSWDDLDREQDQTKKKPSSKDSSKREKKAPSGVKKPKERKTEDDAGILSPRRRREKDAPPSSSSSSSSASEKVKKKPKKPKSGGAAGSSSPPVLSEDGKKLVKKKKKAKVEETKQPKSEDCWDDEFPDFGPPASLSKSSDVPASLSSSSLSLSSSSSVSSKSTSSSSKEKPKPKSKVVDEDDWDSAFSDADFSGLGGRPAEPLSIPKKPEIVIKDDSDDGWGDVDMTSFTPKMSLPSSSKSQKDSDGFGDDFDDGFGDDFEGSNFAVLLQKKADQSNNEGEETVDPNALFDVFDDEDFQTTKSDNNELMTDQILKFLQLLEQSQSDEITVSASRELISLFEDHPEEKSRIIRSIGVLPFLEIMEGASDKKLQVMLQLLNALIRFNKEIQENLSMVGGYPVVMNYADKNYSLEIRLEAARFIQEMCARSPFSHQMFIACRGIPVLVKFLETSQSIQDNLELIDMAIRGIYNIFKLHSPTPKNDFCRLFAKCNALKSITSTLFSYIQLLINSRVLKKSQNTNVDLKYSVENLLEIILQFANGDHTVRTYLVDPASMNNIIKSIDLIAVNDIELPWIVSLIKSIKTVSADSQTLSSLQKVGLIPKIVALFDLCDKPTTHSKDLRNLLLQLLHNLTRIDQTRQEEAANSGVIPYLIDTIMVNSPLKQLALEIFIDFAHVRSIRKHLWKHNGVNFYLALLSDWNWVGNALDALLSWLDDEADKIIPIIVSSQENLKNIVSILQKASTTMLASLASNLLRFFSFSKIAAALTLNDLPTVSIILNRLDDKYESHVALVPVNLIKMFVLLYDNHANRKQLVQKFNLIERLQRLANSKLILLSSLAKKLLLAAIEDSK